MPVLKRCSGLITHPNELRKAEGALERANNIIIDADDTIEIRNGFADFGSDFATDTDRAKQVLIYKSRILRHYNSNLEFDSTGNGDFLAFSGSYTETQSGLRIKGIETKGNFYFTTEEGIKRISAKNASGLSTGANFIENAGIPKASDLVADLKPTVGGYLPPQSKCAYRVLWGKRDANNNLLLGAPSGREILINNSDQTLTPEQFSIDFTGASETDVAGNYILFSTRDVDYYLWFSNSSNTTPPQTSETVSRIALEADVDTLGVASASIAAIAGNVISNIGSAVTVEITGTIVLVTNNEDGENVSDAAAQSGGITNVTVSTVVQGNVTEGTSANANINITVPAEINSTDFFYQLYRTAPITVTEGVTLDDLDPGDEMNLAFEANVTDAEISSGIVSFEDITTEDFRAANAFLYTNPNTGDGILQSNERPPIAKDLALFRNSTFYSNTKSTHRFQFNLLSVSAFTSGTSNFIVGNSTSVREYTFIGETEVYDITTDTFANTTADSILLLSSSRDERQYYVWFDKGGGTDPLVVDRIGVRIDISGTTTAADISAILATDLELLDDFNAVDNGGSVTVTLSKNGETTDPAFGAVVPGGAWVLTVTTQGEGEDTSAQEVLLSSLISVGQAIDETARSLIRVINRDPSSPVNAFYLSGPDDVPGIILLESRSQIDDTFYIATSDSNITNQFDPNLTTTETLTAITVGEPTTITSASHGLTTGDTIYLYGTDSTPAPFGAFDVTVLDTDNFTIPFLTTSPGTTGIWYRGDVASDNEETPNRLFYSKTSQPEAVPLVNFIDIGAQDKAIQRILALRDSLFVLKEDGIFIVTGTTAPNFSSRLLDGTVRIQSPDSAVVLNNQIYALASEGVVSITESGVSIISRPIENLIEGFLNSQFDFKTISFGVAYDFDKAYLLWAPTRTSDTIATQCYRYHTITNTWTRWTKEATCGLVDDDINELFIGSGTRNFIEKERKNLDRTDKADRNFTLNIGANSVDGESINISSIADLALGDVVVQDQYVTISEYNRLLRKLDIDFGLDDKDYEATLKMVAGDNLKNSLDALNVKLVADDDSGNITSRIFSVDFATIQSEYNLMIDELNLDSTDTSFKDYSQSEDTKPYEGIIEEIITIGNIIVLNNSYPWIQGDIDAYKGIDVSVQWAPQDFGAADVLKQVREGSFLFDQNNFYSGTISYASDLSQNFEEIDFLGRGVGDWGAGNWGEYEWGGFGSEVPIRTLIPKQKQRCRFMKVKFDHINARENVRIIGISLEPRPLSKRAYR